MSILQNNWYYFHLFKYKTYKRDEIKENFRLFFEVHKRILNLENPTLFNDCIVWLKLFWRDDLAMECANKFTSRNYVIKSIGEEYLSPLIHVFDNPEEIDFDLLPKSYAIKMSQGAGMNIIVSDSLKVNRKEIIAKLKKWKKIDYYYMAREWVYYGTPRKILIEENLINDESMELIDYKFFCFDGKPKVYYIGKKTYDETGTPQKKRNYFTSDGEEIIFKDEEIVFDKPTKQEDFIIKMLDLSKTLSSPFPHCRTDFYYVNSRIILGEITFFHSAGLEKFPSIEFEKYLGSFFKFEDIK